MLLKEITIPPDIAPFDDMQTADVGDKMVVGRDKRGVDRERIGKTTNKNSNLSKALRIKHLVQMKKRDRSQTPGMDDTPHQYNMGGHASTNGAGLSR